MHALTPDGGLCHRLLRDRAEALAICPTRARAATDLAALETVAVELGATRARRIDARQVVIDERVTMKCRVPPCEYYGLCHLCPPHSPTATEFAGFLVRYRHALLLQVETRLSESFKKLVSEHDGKGYSALYREPGWAAAYHDTMLPLWHRLHLAVIAVERAAVRRGHVGALALGAGNCAFCDPVGLELRCRRLGLPTPARSQDPPVARPPSAPATAFCDLTRPCPFPAVARPAMEAMGIDVVRTLRGVGWELRFPAGSHPGGVVFYTGLVLVA